VKNQRLHPLDELGIRAPVEIGVAIYRLLTGPLRMQVDAVVGGLETNVARQNMDFFHTPLMVVHGTVAYAATTSYRHFMYLQRNSHAFAFLVSDLSVGLGRVEAIEQALALPGEQALEALLALRRDLQVPTSSLAPPRGLSPLSALDLPERRAAMPIRRRLLDVGERLRATDLLRSLSLAEATVLGTLMERCTATAGEVILREGESGEALFLIEAGQAEVRIRGRAGCSEVLARLGPGEYFGEIALLTGGVHAADVVATTPLILMKLSTDTYTRYLSDLVEVTQHLSRTAASRASELLYRRRQGRHIAAARRTRWPPLYGRTRAHPAHCGTVGALP
jgi:CRP-like cAMP-binding protein